MSRCDLLLLTLTVSHTIRNEACPGVVFYFWHTLYPIQYEMKRVPVWFSTSDIHCIPYNMEWSVSRCGLLLLTYTVSHTIRNEACPGVVFYFWHTLYPIQYVMKHVPVWSCTSDIHCIPYNTEWSMSRCGLVLLTYTVSHTIRNEACPGVVFYFWHTLYPIQYGMKHVPMWSSTSDIHCPIQYGMKHIPVWSTSDIHCIPYNTEWSMSRCGLLLLTYTVSHTIRNEACPGVVFYFWHTLYPIQWSMPRCGLLLIYTLSHTMRDEACPGVVNFWHTVYPIQYGMKHIPVWSTSDIHCIPYNTEWSMSRCGFLLLTYTVSHTIWTTAPCSLFILFWADLCDMYLTHLPLVPHLC